MLVGLTPKSSADPSAARGRSILPGWTPASLRSSRKLGSRLYPRNSSRSRFTSTAEIAIKACNPAETSADSPKPRGSSRYSAVGLRQPAMQDVELSCD
jgi:hypothetical protein